MPNGIWTAAEAGALYESDYKALSVTTRLFVVHVDEDYMYYMIVSSGRIYCSSKWMQKWTKIA